MIHQKLKYTEYIIFKILEWYSELGCDYLSEEFVFDKLKLLAMIFFISTANSSEDDIDLLELFDNFYASSHGHQEHDVYKHLPDSTVYKIHRKLEILKPYVRIEDDKYTEMIDKAISTLKLIDINFIKKRSWELALTMHAYFSQRYTYENYGYVHIKTDLIKYDTKYYSPRSDLEFMQFTKV